MGGAIYPSPSGIGFCWNLIIEPCEVRTDVTGDRQESFGRAWLPDNRNFVRREARLLDTDVKLEMEQFFGELSRARESALLLDYDGTLSPFQLDREEAFPYPGVSILLTEIMNTGHTRVVLITGRPAPEVVPLLGIRPHPEIFGAHGLQHLRSGGPCELPHPNKIETQALAKADTWLDGLGLHHLAEHKPGRLGCALARAAD